MSKLKRLCESRTPTVYLVMNERNRYGLTCQVMISGSPKLIGLMGEDMGMLSDEIMLKEIVGVHSVLGSCPGIEIAIIRRRDVH